MKIEKNKDISLLNTFGIRQFCDNFYFFEKNEELLDFHFDNKTLILGGGSNIIIVTKPNNVVKLRFDSIEVVEKTDNYAIVKAQGGGEWDTLVKFCVENNFWGIENLSAIPGTVGAAPIQNIGAYGVEIKDVLQSVEFFDIETKSFKIIENKDCHFDYRTSIFKNKLKNKAIVVSITLKLSVSPKPNLNYADLKMLSQKDNFSILDIRNEVVRVRDIKLPDFKKLGNCGSFYKNAIVDFKKFEELKQKYPQIPSYQHTNGVKIPTAWLIETAGLKGFKKGNVGIYDKHSLIVVNYGGASGNEILNFSEFVENSVFYEFGIKIEKEVNIF